MKKILFFCSTIHNAGGIERVSVEIVNALVKTGMYEIFILNIVGDNESFFKISDDVVIYSLNLKSSNIKNNAIKVIYELRAFVVNKNIDVIVDVDSILTVFSTVSLLGLKKKHICWEHFNYSVNLGSIFRSAGRLLAKNYCDYVVTLTEKDRNLWINKEKKKQAKIITINNPSPFVISEHRPSLHSKKFIAVGRLTHQKGFDFLIEAWSLFCLKNKDWSLQIIGSGEDEYKLKKQVENYNLLQRIEFIPATKNIEFYYQQASFYCMTSRFEGLPMVLLESQSYGLPIIAFDCDCGPSDIINNYENGVLVDLGDVGSFSKKMEWLIGLKETDYSKMIDSAKTSSKKYALDIILEKWKEIL